jgi:regulator of protease activity HflC (stomatin/prohibitin superfamily)
MKTQTLNISSQQVMTSDNLSVTIDAVCFFNIVDAEKCKFNVEDYLISIDSLSKTTLRTIIGENDLNTLFSKRSVINKRVTELIENYSRHWGVNIVSIEIKDVSIPDDLKRSMSQISEAKMQAQAKLIYAEADSKSVNILKDASKELEKCPDALKLIWFNTLKEISKEKSNTIVVSESISLQNLCGKY